MPKLNPKQIKAVKAAVRQLEKVYESLSGSCLPINGGKILAAASDLERQGGYLQRIGGHHPEGWVAPGSCRVVIDGDAFGRRLLGGVLVTDESIPDDADFMVYPSFDEANAAAVEAFHVLSDLTDYEIHQYVLTKDGAEWYKHSVVSRDCAR